MAPERIITTIPLAIACIVLLALVADAADEDPLQDFCVSLGRDSKITINGAECKPADKVQARDFKSEVLRNAADTTGKLGSNVTNANVAAFPGLNTLGVSFARIDYAPGGVNPPHVHPRGTELLFLHQGTLYVGFVQTAQGNLNKLFAETIYPGDLFVFPRGLIHFQINLSKEPALAFAGFNSQNPGASQVAKAVFASDPPILDDVIEKTFQIDDDLVQKLRDLVGQT